jgi:hypothetical protein
MKKSLSIVLFLLVLLALTATGCVSKSNYEALLSDYNRISEGNKLLNEQLTVYNGELKLKESERQELETKYNKVLEENGAMQEQIEQYTNELNMKNLEVESLRQKDSVVAYEALQQKNSELYQELEKALEETQEAENHVKQLEKQIEEYEELELYKDIWSSRVKSGVQPYFRDVYLVNNSNAVDPLYKELLEFIKSDRTDKNTYIEDVYMCGDFAEDMHNNAESVGIKAGWVAILLKDGNYHACNVFKTVDKGLIFIDCTGSKAGERGPSSCDKKVSVKVGSGYRPKPLVESRWRWYSLGEIRDVEIYW